MLASGVFAGVIDQDYAYGRTDPDGKRFGDELERIVGAPDLSPDVFEIASKSLQAA